MLHAAHILCLGTSTATWTQAVHLARCLEATLHVVPALPSERPASTPTKGAPISVEAATVPTRLVRARTDSVPAVLRYVSDADIDLVVADASPDRGPVAPLTTDRLQALARRLARPLFGVEHQDSPDAVQHLFVPTDLSDRALWAFRHAVALARLYDATIDVLHVMESLPYVALTPTDRLSLGTQPLSERRGRRRLRAFLADGEAPNVQVRSHIMHGDAADQIIRFVDRADMDLTVLSAHGRNAREDPIGAVGARVLRRTACSLFLLRGAGPSLLSPSDEGA
ncbi:universal stress protein [Salinibacter altiplanensis]|uniref:universal stress protein n=1 Tax=Salinibacter altiplanensis TaxID=1803181 RepID=UPI000C9FCC35|nr:universal stress protein [Salinibacter altiplanensis]